MYTEDQKKKKKVAYILPALRDHNLFSSRKGHDSKTSKFWWAKLSAWQSRLTDRPAAPISPFWRCQVILSPDQVRVAVMRCLSCNQSKGHEQMPSHPGSLSVQTTLYINSSPTISNYHNDKPGSFPKAHGQICSLPRDWQWLLRGKSEGKRSTDSDKNDCMLAVHPRIKKKIPITILELPGKYPIVHELKLATSLKTWNNKRSASIEYPGHFYLSKTWTFFIAQLKMHVSQKSSLLPPGKSVMPIPKKNTMSTLLLKLLSGAKIKGAFSPSNQQITRLQVPSRSAWSQLLPLVRSGVCSPLDLPAMWLGL